MFKINFRITNDIQDFETLTENDINEGDFFEGFFEIQINDKKYGYYKEGILTLGEQGDELLTTWFEGLLELLIEFKNGHNYIAISDLDSYNTWLEFKFLDKNNVSISTLNAKKENGVGQLITEQPKDAQYPNLKNEIVHYDEIESEIIQKVNSYLTTIGELSKTWLNGQGLMRLKKLVDCVREKQ